MHFSLHVRINTFFGYFVFNTWFTVREKISRTGATLAGTCTLIDSLDSLITLDYTRSLNYRLWAVCTAKLDSRECH